MAGPIVISVLGDTRDLIRGLDQGESRLGRFGKAAGGLGKVAAAGLAAAGAAAGAFALSAVKSASDAQQSVGATSTVFGRYADQVVARSNEAAQAYGLSANEYRESANLIGALFKNQGVGLDQLGAKTDKMVGTAADLAATFGGTTSDAVTALSAAFKGEFDSLEKYGISLKASTISAEVAARGQDNLTGAALEAAKQQATTRLIMRQAGDALGAFGRESNTLAGQQQRLGAAWENLKAKAGTVLLPVLTRLAEFTNSRLLPAFAAAGPPIRRFAQVAGDRLAPILSRVAGVFTGTVLPAVTRFAGYVTGRVVPAVVRVATRVGGSLRPVLVAGAGVVARITDKFRQWQPTIVRVIGVVGRVTGLVLRFGAAVLGRVLPPVIRFAGYLLVNVVGAVIKVIGVVAKIIGKVIDFGAALVRGGAKVVEFGRKVGDAVGRALEWFRDLPGRAVSAVGSLGSTLYNAGASLIQGLINGVTAKIGALRDKLSSVTNLIPDWKGPAERDRVLLTPAGRLLIDGLIAGLDDRLPDLRRALGAVTEEVARTSLPGLEVGPARVAGPRRLRAAGAGPGGRTYNVRITAPVGASPATIGRQLVRYIDAYESVGGRRRAT